MRTMHVKVGAKHIAEASRKDSNHYMIADAIRDKYPNAKWIKVDTQSVRFSDEKLRKRYFYFTPPFAQLKLLAFDRGDTIEPFAFNLTDGIERGMGWKHGHPNSSRKGKKYRKTGKTRIVARREREFGLRKLVAP